MWNKYKDSNRSVTRFWYVMFYPCKAFVNFGAYIRRNSKHIAHVSDGKQVFKDIWFVAALDINKCTDSNSEFPSKVSLCELSILMIKDDILLFNKFFYCETIFQIILGRIYDCKLYKKCVFVHFISRIK